MADVRSMLRAERESRRITHPHASYTSAGTLLCNVCEVPIKSERAWNAHLHTTQHSSKLGRERAAAPRKEDVAPSKKRKAVEFEEPPEAERKKVKPETSPDHDDVLDDSDTAQQETIVEVPAPVVESQDIDDEAAAAELEALQRDLAALEGDMEPGNHALAALSAPATIAAPAMTAQELAAQAREEQSRQRSRRDEEIENEREDAARALEDEFEEMDGLQERLKKLRERREALRGQDGTKPPPAQEGHTVGDIPDRSVKPLDAVVEDDSDDSDEFDDWAFGAR